MSPLIQNPIRFGHVETLRMVLCYVLHPARGRGGRALSKLSRLIWFRMRALPVVDALDVWLPLRALDPAPTPTPLSALSGFRNPGPYPVFGGVGGALLLFPLPWVARIPVPKPAPYSSPSFAGVRGRASESVVRLLNWLLWLILLPLRPPVEDASAASSSTGSPGGFVDSRRSHSGGPCLRAAPRLFDPVAVTAAAAGSIAPVAAVVVLRMRWGMSSSLPPCFSAWCSALRIVSSASGDLAPDARGPGGGGGRCVGAGGIFAVVDLRRRLLLQLPAR